MERSHFGLLTKNYSLRGDAHPLVTGFKFKSPKPPFQGFVTLAEAEAYMGVENYEYKIKDGAGETTPHKGHMAYYTVANSRNPGIQQAENFITDWVEMYACVVKAKIKSELSSGHRPAQMRGTPVPLSLKTEYNNEDEELADSMGRMGMQN